MGCVLAGAYILALGVGLYGMLLVARPDGADRWAALTPFWREVLLSGMLVLAVSIVVMALQHLYQTITQRGGDDDGER